MKLKVSLRSSQEPNTCSYPVPVESRPLPHIPFIFLLVQILVICPRTYLSRLLQLLIQLQLLLQLRGTVTYGNKRCTLR
jgi:hypothetical protein